MAGEIKNMIAGCSTAGGTTAATGLTVGAGLARGLIRFAGSKGASEIELARLCGADFVALEDQDKRVPMANYITLMRAAKEMTGDPAFALHYGEAVDLSELSIVGLIMNASETMGEAFIQMNRFGRLAIEFDGAGDRFKHARNDAGVWLVDTRANPNDFPELTEVTFARQTCSPRRFLPMPHVLEVHVTHADPGYRDEYDRIFRCPVVFDSHWNAMRMDPATSSHRVALQPRYVFGVLSERAADLLKDLQGSKTSRGRVESLLMPILHTGDISMDTIAAKMGVSRQTLRHRLAVHYLDGRKVSVNETAYLVGFSDPAAFSRAFKRWTGSSPRNRRG
jgi:Arabinose-binding domain of AraC transcription regulator, N-term/Helix-turn-helix domain